MVLSVYCDVAISAPFEIYSKEWTIFINDFKHNLNIILKMATSTLIIYEPIEKFKQKSRYWHEYVRYYEKYWGGPPSPLGVWFGNEYEIFRRKLAEELSMEEDEVVDCFFLKDDKGNYYIAPPDHVNIFSSKNVVPVEWFVLFSESERKELHSHWGFNAVYYTASIADAHDRLLRGKTILSGALESSKHEDMDVYLKSQLNLIAEGIDNMLSLLSGFDMRGYVVLNYGDICSVIHPYTLKNERSVREIDDFLNMVGEQKYSKASSFLGIFNEKWGEIRRKCSGEIDKSYIQ